MIRVRRWAGALLASALLTACRAGGGVFLSVPEARGLRVMVSVPEAHGLRVTAHEENGIFLDHGFDSSVMSDRRIRKVVGWLKARAFTYQLHNITAFNADGTMDPAKYSQLAHWIRVSRAADPHQKIVAYLSGSLALVNTASTWHEIARVCRMFVKRYGVDGVNLDFEPYRTNNVANYKGLFRTVRRAIGTSPDLSLDYTADPGYQWTPSDFKAVSAYFNMIMPMLYDTSCRSKSCYTALLAKILAYQYAHKAANAEIYPLIPTYTKSRWHDPAVENIATAATEIRSLQNAKNIGIVGVGVWWYYGWNHAAESDWEKDWLK